MKLLRHVLQLMLFIPTLFGHQIFNDDTRALGGKRLRLNSKMSNFRDATYKSNISPESISVPWLVSLRQKINNQHFCVGSLISHFFIISVAQCATGQLPENIIVVVDIENLFIGGFKYDINDVFIHPEFSQGTNKRETNNNLALFKTRKPIIFTNNVHPIALESDCTTSYEELNMYGFSFVPHGQSINWKMGVQMTKILSLDQEMCALHEARSLAEYLILKQNSRNLCTYFMSTPLFCIDTPGNSIVSTSNSVKNTPRLVAISSKTNSCYIKYPTTSTRIASHIGWISKIMRINEPQIVKI